MTVIHPRDNALRAGNKPDWCQTPAAGYFRMPKEGGTHDCHYHDYNELYLVCRGKAKILNDGKEYYVTAHDVVCIKAGNEHDILEIYGDEDLELFWLYEPGPESGRFGHLHRVPDKAEGHPVPSKPIPPDFPT
jgi:mannose-6-phosphate isomerase-like protein (cupin superfamily)